MVSPKFAELEGLIKDEYWDCDFFKLLLSFIVGFKQKIKDWVSYNKLKADCAYNGHLVTHSRTNTSRPNKIKLNSHNIFRSEKLTLF